MNKRVLMSTLKANNGTYPNLIIAALFSAFIHCLMFLPYSDGSTDEAKESKAALEHSLSELNFENAPIATEEANEQEELLAEKDLTHAQLEEAATPKAKAASVMPANPIEMPTQTQQASSAQEAMPTSAESSPELGPATETETEITKLDAFSPLHADDQATPAPLIRFDVSDPVWTLKAAKELGLRVVLNTPEAVYQLTLDEDDSWRVLSARELQGGQVRLRKLPSIYRGRRLLFADIVTDALRSHVPGKKGSLALLVDDNTDAKLRGLLNNYCSQQGLSPTRVVVAVAAFVEKEEGDFALAIQSHKLRSQNAD